MRGHPNIRVVIEALRRVENTVHVTWNEFKTRPRPPKQDHFADELVAIMKMRERRWSGDTLGFVDALSRIPVVIMLKWEKRQLEFWRENCEGDDTSRDTAERRISEVTSLLDGDQTSLLEIRENVSCVDVKAHMNVITKGALDRRKMRLREKIEEIKSKSSSRGDEQRRTKQSNDFVDIETESELTASCQNELDAGLDEMACTEIPVSGTRKNGDGTSSRHARRQRRRPSVVAKMNKAIHRRARGR